MQVLVRFTGQMRVLAGCAELTVMPAEGTSLAELLGQLRDRLPPACVRQLLDVIASGGGGPALLLLNRRHVRTTEDLDRILADGDVVAFVPPMDGGS